MSNYNTFWQKTSDLRNKILKKRGGGVKHIFIVNPAAGKKDKTREIQARLEQLAKDDEFDYLLFISEYEGHETELAKQLCDLFMTERIRLYACGGSGTLQRVLNGTIGAHDVEIAFVPLGFTNDFLKNFNCRRSEFLNIENLINGKVIRVDCTDVNENQYRGINASDFGIIGYAMRQNDLCKIISRVAPNFIYSICCIIECMTVKNTDYELILDGEDYSGKYSCIMIYNGAFQGGNIAPIKTTNPTDGKFNVVTLSSELSFVRSLRILASLQKGDIHSCKDSAYIQSFMASEVRVKCKNAKDNIINIDGEFYHGDRYTITNRPSRIDFVIPEHAGIKAYCGERDVKKKKKELFDFSMS